MNLTSNRSYEMVDDIIYFASLIEDYVEYRKEVETKKMKSIQKYDDSSGCFSGADHGEEVIISSAPRNVYSSLGEFILDNLIVGFKIDNKDDAIEFARNCKAITITTGEMDRGIRERSGALGGISEIFSEVSSIHNIKLISDENDHYFVVFESDPLLISFAYRYFN